MDKPNKDHINTLKEFLKRNMISLWAAVEIMQDADKQRGLVVFVKDGDGPALGKFFSAQDWKDDPAPFDDHVVTCITNQVITHNPVDQFVFVACHYTDLGTGEGLMNLEHAIIDYEMVRLLQQDFAEFIIKKAKNDMPFIQKANLS